MWAARALVGDQLPPQTLVLTFDDGPGRDTIEIAAFLRESGIRATFFLTGEHVLERPDDPKRLRALGQDVGSHAFHHRQLTSCAISVREVAEDIAAAQKLLSEGSDPLFFRPPYGAWNARLSFLLNADAGLRDAHVGPIGWDWGGTDWQCWLKGLGPSDYLHRLIRELGTRKHKNGILLLHDRSADLAQATERNRTKELVELLIPGLLSEGFRFVDLCSVPAISRFIKRRVKSPE